MKNHPFALVITLLLSCQDNPTIQSNVNNNQSDVDSGTSDATDITDSRDDFDSNIEDIPAPCTPENTPLHFSTSYFDIQSTVDEYEIIKHETSFTTRVLYLVSDNTPLASIVYSDPDIDEERLDGLQEGDVVTVTANSTSECGYSVLRNPEGQIVFEGGDQCFYCLGDPVEFEEVCAPRIRIDYEAGPSAARCRIVETAPADSQACAYQWVSYPMYVRDDRGEHRIFTNQPLKLIVEGETYIAFSYRGGYLHCPCATNCTGFRTDFMMLPARSVLPR